MNDTPNPRYQISNTVFRSDDLDELIAHCLRKGTERRLWIWDRHKDEVVFVAENHTSIGYEMTQVFPPTWKEFEKVRTDRDNWRSRAIWLRTDMDSIATLTKRATRTSW